MSKYKTELERKVISLRSQIKQLNIKIDQHPKCDKVWDDMIRELNNLNTDLQIAKSRLANLGKPRSGIEEYSIIVETKNR